LQASADPTATIVNHDVEVAAAAATVQVRLVDVRTVDEIEPAFASAVAWPADAVNVSSNQPLNGEGARVAELAVGYRLPAIYQTRMYVDRGGLMSYGRERQPAGVSSWGPGPPMRERPHRWPRQ
jgi:putative ABC transport system substrate-binding protein